VERSRSSLGVGLIAILVVVIGAFAGDLHGGWRIAASVFVGLAAIDELLVRRPFYAAAWVIVCGLGAAGVLLIAPWAVVPGILVGALVATPLASKNS
jgi:hypothetical protein